MLEQPIYSLKLLCYGAGMKTPSKLSPKYAGRLGGLKGGRARAQSLSPEDRSAIAKKAAEARWGKRDNDHKEKARPHKM